MASIKFENVLVFIPEQLCLINLENAAVKDMSKHFCGTVLRDNVEEFNNELTKAKNKLYKYKHENVYCMNYETEIKECEKTISEYENKVIYLCGDIAKNAEYFKHQKKVCFIEDISYNYEIVLKYRELVPVSIGQVPLNVHNQGVMFKEFFHPTDKQIEFVKTMCPDTTKTNYHFKETSGFHGFQQLTESNKEGFSYRKGLYITDVNKVNTKRGSDVHFKLLRCSTNLQGPTEGFSLDDRERIYSVNEAAKDCFNNPGELNHVLAQIYENQVINDKQKKAKITSHSDKTKDMPENGLIAFCTFYDKLETLGPEVKKNNTQTNDLFDYTYKHKTTVLTKLRFKLKDGINQNLVNQFDIKLYPNSVFIIPLETNRYYTHEIVPSTLPVDKIPTRLGYVMRCSNTDAVFRDGKTYILADGKETLLDEPTENDRTLIKSFYYQENLTDKKVHYGHIKFSLNMGDYQKPKIMYA